MSNYSGISSPYITRYLDKYNLMFQLNGEDGLWEELLYDPATDIYEGCGFFIFYKDDGAGPFSSYKNSMEFIWQCIQDDDSLIFEEKMQAWKFAKVYFGCVQFKNNEPILKDLECVKDE